MQQFNARGGRSSAGLSAPKKPMTFTGSSITKMLMALLVAGGLFLSWQMLGPSSALAWNVDINTARAEAVKTNKPILIFYTADWCPPCQQFKKSTLTDDTVELALERDWVLMKVDLTERGGSNAALARSLGVNSIPTFQVFNTDGTQFESRRGYTTPAVFVAWLESCKQRMR